MSHNLDIRSYSLDEIYDLLKLPKNPNKTDMMTAKKRVLMFHPDKSKLPNEYFLFYKEAYTIATNYYEEQNRQNREVSKEQTEYASESLTNDKRMDEMIKKNVKDLSNEQFNKLYENNMVEKKEYKNHWFKEKKAQIKMGNTETVSSKNINTIFEQIKDKNNSSMVVHKEFQSLTYSSGNKLFDDDEDKSDFYISSDPFSKLKYDDLRKVHKDQTIFAVGEKDFHNIPKYASVDDYANQRAKPVEALSEAESLKHLSHQESMMRERYSQNQHKSTMDTMKFQDKNKQILASFMKIKN
jgi:hypothetical protein